MRRLGISRTGSVFGDDGGVVNKKKPQCEGVIYGIGPAYKTSQCPNKSAGPVKFKRTGQRELCAVCRDVARDMETGVPLWKRKVEVTG
jgi:hypothetical protein